jgi:hypothetical protein
MPLIVVVPITHNRGLPNGDMGNGNIWRNGNKPFSYRIWKKEGLRFKTSVMFTTEQKVFIVISFLASG